jgi:hypothetical protein
MLLLFHGATGGLDELVIAVVAVGVLWLAVKLAGRKPSAEDDEQTEVETEPGVEDQHEPAAPSR